MRFAPTLLPLFVVACVPASRPPEPPAPAPSVAAPAPVALPPALGPDWRDWPLTPGEWRYGRDAGGSAAVFGSAGAEPLLLLRCDANARSVLLSLAGADSTTATLRTTSTTRAVPLQPAGGATTQAALTAADPLLDALAFSRGRFTVERPGRAPLVVPAHAEIARVTEDCRG